MALVTFLLLALSGISVDSTTNTFTEYGTKPPDLGPPLDVENITVFVERHFRKYFQYALNIGDQIGPEDENEWVTPAKLLKLIYAHPQRSGIGTWKCNDCYTHITDHLAGHHLIMWRRRDNYISMISYDTGEVCQTWVFELSAKIVIKMTPRNNDIVEYWVMPNAQFVYQRDGNATAYVWRNNVQDVESLMKYRRYISTWCENNEKWVARFGLPCKIYSLTDEQIYNV